MPPKVPPTELPIHSFPNPSAFSAFLSNNHDLPGIYLKLAKKHTAIPSITGSQAVEVALCHGWIDGRANSIDSDFWTVRYTPRRKKSLWSKKNVETVGRLIEEGRMTEMGMRCVEEAKGDGRWEKAYAGPSTMEVPEDFKTVLEERGKERARELWEGLNRSQRYSVLWRVETASVKSRQGRIEALVEQLGEGKVPGDEDREKYSGKGKKTVKVERDRVEKKTKTNTKGKVAVSKKGKEEVEAVKAVADEVRNGSRRAGLRTRT